MILVRGDNESVNLPVECLLLKAIWKGNYTRNYSLIQILKVHQKILLSFSGISSFLNYDFSMKCSRIPIGNLL